jgi:alpha-aminoadipic semialdehyde synthase
MIPQKVSELRKEHAYEIYVQPSPIRVFKDEEYAEAGAIVQEDLSPASVIFAIKEIPPGLVLPEKTYAFFAHVIKGQPHNMPMLRRLLDLHCNVLDYEMVTDEQGRRLIFFGWHAGVAGMIDTLWAFGQRLEAEGLSSPFSLIKNTYKYDHLGEAKIALQQVGEHIRTEGLPEGLAPMVIGVAGYGNVGRGVQAMLDELGAQEVDPSEIAGLFDDAYPSGNVVYQVTFKEEHIVEPIDPTMAFDLQYYYQHGDEYRGCFERYLPYLSILVNANYWNGRYPRLVTKDYLRQMYRQTRPPRLRVIGDVSCDIEGAIQATVRATEPDCPVYVFNPETGETVDGVVGKGPVIMAVDILPSELPREASEHFGDMLGSYIPAIVQADYTVPFGQLDLPPELKRAIIVYQGELTPDYEYIAEFLDREPDVESAIHV